jgi:hypothetical protein
VGGSIGWTNDVVREDAQFDSFKFGHYVRMVRVLDGGERSSPTQWRHVQDESRPTRVDHRDADGSDHVPELDERVQLRMVSVSYRFWEGFFTSGSSAESAATASIRATSDPQYAA